MLWIRIFFSFFFTFYNLFSVAKKQKKRKHNNMKTFNLCPHLSHYCVDETSKQIATIHDLGYKRVLLPPYEVTDTPFISKTTKCCGRVEIKRAIIVKVVQWVVQRVPHCFAKTKGSNCLLYKWSVTAFWLCSSIQRKVISWDWYRSQTV